MEREEGEDQEEDGGGGRTSVVGEQRLGSREKTAG